MTNCLSSALDYAAKDLSVLPCYSPDDQGRCRCGKPDCADNGKHPVGSLVPHGLTDATTDETKIRAWWKQCPQANVAFRVPSDMVVIDVDGAQGFEALKEKGYHLPATAIAKTARGNHYLYRTDHPVRPKVGVLPKVDIRGEGSYIIAAPSRHASGAVYEWAASLDEIADAPAWIDALTNGKGHRQSAEPSDGTIPEPGRNAHMASLAGSMRRRGMTPEAIEVALLEENTRRCAPPMDDDEVCGIARSIGSYPPAAPDHNDDLEVEIEDWPARANVDAFYGIAGDLVAVFSPHTEGDPNAILIQILVLAGNCIGRGPHCVIEGRAHFTNESVVLVGNTGSGRKGTAEGRARQPFRAIEAEWERDRILGGSSTGEGLIHAVRDARIEKQPIKEKGRIVGYQEVEVDPGVSDKRLVLLESEFARVLQVSQREGSTLSETLRRAWDGTKLEVLTRAPYKATDTHVSIIGHITPAELLHHLDKTNAANGSFNRCLWICCKRSKLLPNGSEPDPVALAPLYSRLERAIRAARKVGCMTRDPKAAALWTEVYPGLSIERAGMLGALAARGTAHIARLSMIYALLDSSSVVKLPHLQAALAVWNYAERSCAFVFGDSLGDPLADELLRALRDAGAHGMSRTDIRDHFKRNKSAADIGHALKLLAQQGLATRTTEQTGSRPLERWSVTS